MSKRRGPAPFKIPWWLECALMAIGATQAIAQALESSPCGALREDLAARLRFGQEADQLGELDWEMHEVQTGPGPLYVDADGKLYLADKSRAQVKVLSAGGDWINNIELPVGKTLMDDCVYRAGHLVYFADTVFGYGAVDLDVNSGEATDVAITTEIKESSRIRIGQDGRLDHRTAPVWGQSRLSAIGPWIELCNAASGLSVPLRGPAGAIAPSEQQSSVRHGRPCGDARVWQVQTEDRAHDLARGDIVQVDPDGTVNRVILKSPGRLWDCRADRMLIEERRGPDRQVHLTIYDLSGRCVSTMPIPDRFALGMIECRPRFSLGPDGSSAYEIYLTTDHTLVIARWH